jgi:hypothetical protein
MDLDLDALFDALPKLELVLVRHAAADGDDAPPTGAHANMSVLTYLRLCMPCGRG